LELRTLGIWGMNSEAGETRKPSRLNTKPSVVHLQLSAPRCIANRVGLIGEWYHFPRHHSIRTVVTAACPSPGLLSREWGGRRRRGGRNLALRTMIRQTGPALGKGRFSPKRYTVRYSSRNRSTDCFPMIPHPPFPQLFFVACMTWMRAVSQRSAWMACQRPGAWQPPSPEPTRRLEESRDRRDLDRPKAR
jgi:hypothetical protein